MSTPGDILKPNVTRTLSETHEISQIDPHYVGHVRGTTFRTFRRFAEYITSGVGLSTDGISIYKKVPSRNETMFVDMLQDFLFNIDLEKSILIQNDYLVYGIVFAYITFVKFLGPSLMKQRLALNLYYFVILFNVILVVWNAYLCFAGTVLVRRFWHIRCYLKYNPEFKLYVQEFGYLAWHGLLIKLVELIDTVIFILRKKFNQATFLHVFHHSIVVVLYWTVLKKNEIAYYVLLMGTINFGVHVVMYFYYGLSSIGPSVRKYLWWKKYLTVIQLVQFFIIILYLAYGFLTDCEEFGVFEKMIFGQLIIISSLFFNFYLKAYSQPK